MGLFDFLKKQDCEICGKEVGLFGYKKLEDGEICNACVKKLSPWFDDRRHSTVEQIKQQLAYREENEKQLASFHVTQVIGDAYKMYVEEVNGVPTRFFISDARDYMEENPDIIEFKNVLSCTTDIRTYKREMKRRDANGDMVSYNPPRYEVDHDFYIEMQIGNTPWFDDISFYVNSGVVTLETTEASGILGGIFGAAFGNNNITNYAEQQRYDKYQAMCQQIEQLVQLAKMPAAPAAAPAPEPVAAPAPEAPAGPKFCPNCGAPADGGKFCQSCGSKF